MFQPCIVIPHFRHERAIGDMVDKLRPHGIPCWIVDDGSGEEATAVLRRLAEAESGWLRLLALPQNGGKGTAVMSGFAAAAEAGFSHALQIDADGQHDTADVPKLIELARRNPQAVVTGVPVYDQSVPKLRFYGRYLTHILVWVQTLSFEIVDSMCGFRIYPIEPALRLWRSGEVGRRMDFDTSVLVHLYWSGVRIISVPTRVTYPADGVSHFDLLRDNLRMLRLHGRLLGGLLLRLPRWAARRLRGLPARGPAP